MSVQILKAGLLDTIQDRGRFGFSHWGINPGGAMDHYAAAVANALVGNKDTEAVLELHFPAAQLLFEQTALISICGADFQPCLHGEPLPLWQPVVVRRNSVLHFEKAVNGSRCYVAVHGGLDTPLWLGSRSSNSASEINRKLATGDQLGLLEGSFYFAGWLKEDEECTVLPWKAAYRQVYAIESPIGITRGHEWTKLDRPSRERLVNEPFTIGQAADRMGYALKGPVLVLEKHIEMLSTGVTAGTLQLLPDGQLILLMADHQTTGGYPRVGHVHAAALPRLAQSRPGTHLQFRITDPDQAEAAYIKQKRDIAILTRNCLQQLNHKVC